MHRSLIAFAWNAFGLKRKLFWIYRFSPSSSLQLFRSIGEFEVEKYFTGHQLANTIQLFVALKEGFSGLFFFWTIHREGKCSPLFICISLKQKLSNEQKTWLTRHDDIRTECPCCNICLWISFYFVQVNQ